VQNSTDLIKDLSCSEQTVLTPHRYGGSDISQRPSEQVRPGGLSTQKSARLLQLTAGLRPGFGAFRQASQMQQCARLLTSCCQGLPDLRQYRLASMHMTPYLQQRSTICTGVLSHFLAHVTKCFKISFWMDD